MEWIMENWTDLWSIATGVVTIASVVAKLTPTPADDAVMGKIVALIDILALNKSRK